MGAEDELGSATPMAGRSSAPTSSSSDKNTVLLREWWLIKADGGCGGKRLAVGGLMTSNASRAKLQTYKVEMKVGKENRKGCHTEWGGGGCGRSPLEGTSFAKVKIPNWRVVVVGQKKDQDRQQATRVFSSAPIKKRYDAYTLETVDGITVIIQGMINKARTSDNGIPLEVCSHFLIGFPYNWDYYADEYLRKESTSSANVPTCSFGGDEQPKDSADSPGHTFPVHLDEFPMGRIFDILTTAGDTLTKSFTDTLKKLFNHSLLASNAQRSSGLPVKIFHKYETGTSNQRHENIIGSASLVAYDAEGHVAGHAEEQGCSRNNFLEGDTFEEDFVLNHSTSHVSSSPINHETRSQEETGAAMQYETPLESMLELEKNNLIVNPASQECDEVDHILDSLEGKINNETSKESMDMELGNGLNDSLPESSNSSHLKLCNKPGDGAMTRHRSIEELKLCEMDILYNSLVQEVSYANSLKVKMHLKSESTLDSVVSKSSEASIRKEEGVRARPEISLQKETAVSSSFPVFQEGAKLCHFEEEPTSHNDLKVSNADCTGIIKESSSNEIISSQRDPTAQIGSAVDINNAIVSMEGGRKKKNSQKENQKCAESLDKNVDMDFCAPTIHESVDKEKSTGIIPFHKTEELLSTDNVHLISCLGGVRTRSQYKNSSASIVRSSYSVNEASTSLSKGGSVKMLTNPEAETLSSRTKSCKNTTSDDPTMESSLEVEKKQLGSVPIDHNVANAVSDVKRKSSRKHDQGLAAVRAEKCTLQASPEELITECASQLFSASTPAPTDEMRNRVDEHASKHICISNDNDNGASNCSVGHSAKTANQSDMIAELHSCKDKALDATEKKNTKKPSDLDVDQCAVLRREQPSRNKASHATGKKAARRPISYAHQSPFTRDKAKKLSVASPESLNLKRSRSGRLIVPPLVNGYQQIVYDADGLITGIKGLDTWNSPCQGSKSEPVKKRKGIL